MLVFIDRGHSREALIWLYRIRLHLQIIFLSNILLALGLRINPTVLLRWDPCATYSTKKFPKEEPMESDFELWRETVEVICPSQLRIHSVEEFVDETQRIYACQWCTDSNNLLHSAASSATIDVYSNTARKLNHYTKTLTCPWEERGKSAQLTKSSPGYSV
jgi:hypothetical protein